VVSSMTAERLHITWILCRGTRAFGGRSQGPWVLPRDGTQEDEWQVLDLLGSPATSVAASFDQLFKLYRGHRFSEELEALGNEAARSCNRIRTQLPGVHFPPSSHCR
jgi:hypothetical protein